MDIEQFQAIEKQLTEQAEATHITNENLAKRFWMMSTREAKNIALSPPVLAFTIPTLTTILSALQPSRIGLWTPNDFDGDQSKGQAFLTLCEIYTSLTASDFPDDQTQIHWALTYCKSGHAANFAERIVRQEIKTEKMVFTS
jgi:hypothetical protein